MTMGCERQGKLSPPAWMRASAIPAACRRRRCHSVRHRGRTATDVTRDIPRDACNEGGLAAVALLVIGLEPAPRPHRVRDGGLRRVRAQKVLLLGEFVHPHANREILDALPAAVRYHDQRRGAPA